MAYEWELVLRTGSGAPVPVLLTAAGDATGADLRRALTRWGPGPWYADGRRLRDTDRLVETGLHTGGTLHDSSSTVDGSPAADGGARSAVDGRAAAGRPSGGAWRVAVVGGLAAGDTLPVRDGAPVTVGRSGRCDLRLTDPEVSRRHATLTADGDGFSVRDNGSRNGTAVDGRRVADAVRLGDGDPCQVGETVLTPRRPDASVAVLEAAGPELRHNRPPRITAPAPDPEIEVPAAPAAPRGFRFPLASVLVPLLAAGVCYALVPNAGYYLVFLALSPVMAVASLVSDRRSGRRRYRSELRTYQARMAEVRAGIAEVAARHAADARRGLPDPAAVVECATAPTARLFERRPGDADFLHLRVGLADRPAPLRLVGPGAADEPRPVDHLVPVAVDVAAAGVVGVAGPRAARLAASRALLSQAAALHAPHDLGIVVLTGLDTADDWEWASWLPHTRAYAGDSAARRTVGTDAEQAEARLAELRALIDTRRADQRAALRDGAPTGRRILVVVDGARRLRGLTGLADVLADGPATGVYALCLDTEPGDLPDECRATVVSGTPSGTRGTLSVPGAAPLDDVLLDGTTPGAAVLLARALAPIRVLGARQGADDGVPDTVRFLEVAGLPETPTADDVAARWRVTGPACRTTVPVGVGPDGPVELDLRAHGPHALVAGTSGAGKSELLQTLIAGLATANPPDACAFVLVDYKGGSAFADCARLPHCAGLVTDLDGHLVRRALASLGAELRRREAILAVAGAKDIEDYWARTGGRLPRLFIVVDEFASLVEEVPEFVTGVVGIGMRGRSLGVHVVLATQRPAGVVRGELRANLNLRVCLRVTSTDDSADVLDAPDAARLSRRYPGRAYLRTGHGELRLVQTARVGQPRTEVGAAPEPARAVPRHLTELGRSRPAAAPAGPDAHDGDTDLTVLVDAVRTAAAALAVPAPDSPWLPPLPERVVLPELDPPDGRSPATAVLGLADHPERQARGTYVLDLAAVAPVVVAGMARSGRSTALRTIAASLAAASPADLHLYVLDAGTAALAPLAGLPHCGAYVGADDTERTYRLVELLDAEIGRRQRLLAGVGGVAEQRASVPGPDRLPYVVVLVDRYEAVLARYQDTDSGRLVDAVDRLLRSGPAVGILPVLATDRSGFGHRLAGAVATRLVLRHAERDDVATYGLVPRDVPAAMPSGRLVVAPDGTEVQVALLDPDPGGAAQADALRRLAEHATARWDGLDEARRPRRIDPLPDTVDAGELDALRRVPRPAGPGVVTVGAGGDELGPLDVDLVALGGTFLVAGPAGAGRSTALAALVASLAGRTTGELPVIAVCPRPSPLRAIADRPGVLAVLTGPDLAADLEEAVCAAPGPVALALDDAELLTDGALGTLLEQAARQVRDDGSVILAAGTTEDLLMQRHRGFLALVRRARSGLLLNPGSYVDGEVFDLKLPRSTAPAPLPGRGLLVVRGAVTPVQVPADPAVRFR
ncbi:MAG TPA: FtsK/SpoIIIE domain-containing protein [Actinocatenispora sp.]